MLSFIYNFFYDDFIYIFTQLIYSYWSTFFKNEHMQDQLIPKYRIEAIQEKLAGFLVNEVMIPQGEFHAG